MHKIIDGKRIELTRTEEEEVKNRWEANDIKEAQKKLDLETESKEKVVKLRASGIPDEAIKILKPELESFLGD